MPAFRHAILEITVLITTHKSASEIKSVVNLCTTIWVEVHLKFTSVFIVLLSKSKADVKIRINQYFSILIYI